MTSLCPFFGTTKVIKLRETLSPKPMTMVDLELIEIASFSKALRSVWIREYLVESNKGK